MSVKVDVLPNVVTFSEKNVLVNKYPNSKPPNDLNYSDFEIRFSVKFYPLCLKQGATISKGLKTVKMVTVNPSPLVVVEFQTQSYLKIRSIAIKYIEIQDIWKLDF